MHRIWSGKDRRKTERNIAQGTGTPRHIFINDLWLLVTNKQRVKKVKHRVKKPINIESDIGGITVAKQY